MTGDGPDMVLTHALSSAHCVCWALAGPNCTLSATAAQQLCKPEWRNVVKRKLECQKSILWGGTNSLRWCVEGSSAVVTSLRWFLKQYINHLGLLDRYDQFLVTRSDYFYGCTLDMHAGDPMAVQIPLGEENNGENSCS